MVVALRRLVISALVASAPLRAIGTRAIPGDDDMFEEILGLLAEEPAVEEPNIAPRRSDLVVAMDTLSPAAVKVMFEYFLPDAHAPSGLEPHRTDIMRRRLHKEVLLALPGNAIEQLAGLDRVETVGQICHWLAVRLSKMPWLGVLLRKTAGELRHMLLEAGVQVTNIVRQRYLRARILRALVLEGAGAVLRDSAPDAVTLRRLLEQELRDGGQAMPASAAIGYVDECPQIVREELGQPSQGAAGGAFLVRVLSNPLEHIRTALQALPEAAVSAMYQRFMPEYSPLKGTPAARLTSMRLRLSQKVLSTMPPQKLVTRLGQAETIGKLCHWLALQLLRMPWLQVVEKHSTFELRQVLRLAGQARTSNIRAVVVAKILRSAAADSALGTVNATVLRGLLDRGGGQIPRTVAPEDVGYLEECPEAVHEALARRTVEAERLPRE